MDSSVRNAIPFHLTCSFFSYSCRSLTHAHFPITTRLHIFISSIIPSVLAESSATNTTSVYSTTQWHTFIGILSSCRCLCKNCSSLCPSSYMLRLRPLTSPFPPSLHSFISSIISAANQSQQTHQPPTPPVPGLHGGIYLAAAQG